MSESLDDRLQRTLSRIPYAQFLGLRAQLAGDEMTVILPYSPHLIGNLLIPAIHGGVLGAMLEITALTQLSIAQGLVRQPRPIDVTIDYLRSGRPVDTYARATIRRLGRRVSNVHAEAWQEVRGRPIATLHGHFAAPGAGPPPGA